MGQPARHGAGKRGRGVEAVGGGEGAVLRDAAPDMDLLCTAHACTHAQQCYELLRAAHNPKANTQCPRIHGSSVIPQRIQSIAIYNMIPVGLHDTDA